MDAAVQELVDRLAAQLRRPAVLEDRFLRLLAHSAHEGPIDRVRQASILRRNCSPEVTSWLYAMGIRRARGPARLPANHDLDMLARICIPVRHRDVLLGYLWLVDADQTVSAAELERCAPAVAELAALLHRGSIAGVPSVGPVAEALRALLSGSPRAGTAARTLVEEELISGDGETVAVVVQLVRGAAVPSAAFEHALTEAVLASSYLCRRGSALHLARRDHSVLLLSRPSGEPALRPHLVALHAAATAELTATVADAALVIGVGGARPDLVRVGESYREARLAAMAGGVLPAVGPVADWAELGAYQVAARLAANGAAEQLPHAGLQPLLDSPDALPLLETLETYLDAAGNAQVTAERLHLHRTSLYYRLQRIEQLADTDLKDGMERLALHLTLKVARLTGRYVPRTQLARPAQPEADSGLDQVA